MWEICGVKVDIRGEHKYYVGDVLISKLNGCHYEVVDFVHQLETYYPYHLVVLRLLDGDKPGLEDSYPLQFVNEYFEGGTR